jgi:PHD/YefM family antitoxin component YafN of YafNO toxin-antitoxin module
MSTQTVGIREFRDNLAKYLLESSGPVAITRHGDTIGVYLPRRRKRTEAQKKALDEMFERMQAMMAQAGVTEEDIVEDLKRLRKDERQKKARG